MHVFFHSGKVYSRVWNQIQLADLVFMLDKVLFVRRIEVTWDGLGGHGVDDLSLCLWLALELETLECVLVCGLRLKLQWLVL